MNQNKITKMVNLGTINASSPTVFPNLTYQIDSSVNDGVTELSKLLKLVNQTRDINFNKIAIFVNLLNKSNSIDVDEVSNLTSLTHEANDVNLTEINSLVNNAKQQLNQVNH